MYKKQEGLMLETEELISEINSHHILQLNGALTIWPHKHAGKHMVSVSYCCLQFSNSRAVFENLFL